MLTPIISEAVASEQPQCVPMCMFVFVYSFLCDYSRNVFCLFKGQTSHVYLRFVCLCGIHLAKVVRLCMGRWGVHEG